MVKVQKPIPKKMGNKPKLDNPIKNKKQHTKKEKSTSTVKNLKPKLLESPIKDAKAAIKGGKDVIQKTKAAVKPKGLQKKASKDEIKPLVAEKQNEHPKDTKKSKKDAVKNKKAEKIVQKISATLKVKAPVNGVGKTASIPIKVDSPTKGTAPLKKVNSVKAAVAVKIPGKAKVEPPVKAAPQKKVENVPAAKNIVAPQKENSASISKPLAPKKESIATVKPQQGKKKKNKRDSAAVVAEPTPSVGQSKVAKKVIKLQEKKKAKIAFKKAKLTAEGKPSKKNIKKEKMEQRAANAITYEPLPYDEEKLSAIVNVENIKKVAEALKTQVEKEVASKKSSIFDDYRYFLQVGSFKIANCPKRMVKLNLKHSLVDKDDDVLLIVPDLQRGSKADYEPTIHHYEDMLRFHGVEGIKIMPMNQLRKEYSTYEQKRRLCATYDHFLCDGRIVAHAVGIVGKINQKPRHTFHAVRLNIEKDIKNEIEKSLRRTAYRQLAKSSMHAIPVGTHKFTSQQLAENVEHVVEQLKKVFPGGLGNVRNLYLKIDITGTSALPLYISMAQAPELTPLVTGPREQKMIKLKREANEVLSKFAMTKEGKLVKLTKTDAEKKQKLQAMKAALKKDEELLRKELKKTKKGNKNEIKELEDPENEEDIDDDSSNEDDNDILRLGSSSEEDNDDNDILGLLDQDDSESDAEIVENGLVKNADEESEKENDQQANGSDDDDEDDDDEDDNDDDDEADESD